MIVVGVTGSFASGKSEAAGLFKKHGAQVFDADKAAKKAVEKGKASYKAIRKIFGPAYFNKKGQLDRKKLALRVFQNPRDLKKLNILIHPGVIVECFQQIERNKSKKGILVLDVPLLFESHMGSLADWTVVVGASLKNTLARAEKKGVEASMTKKILSTQWSFRKKARLADFVIRNDGSLKDLEEKVGAIEKKIFSHPYQ